MGLKWNVSKMENPVLIQVLITFIYLLGTVSGQDCVPRSYGTNRIVCVCNATYCDYPPAPEKLLKSGYYLQYTSSQDGKRFDPVLYPITNFTSSSSKLAQINSCTQYQEMLGFGGAITDAVGINLGTISKEARELLLKQYYGPQGIGYSFVRTPMGGSDFSTRFYTYDDGAVDRTLSRFSLADEDYKYRIPYLKYIKNLSNPKLVTLPWSPPAWMIEPRNGTIGFTRLRDNYYQLNAEYIVNSIAAYQLEGLDVWGISPQNEPGDGYYVYFGINSCGYSPQEELNFIVNNLGPTLERNGFANISIMITEEQRTKMPEWAELILNNSTAYNYVSGTALHWYFDDLYPADRLSAINDKFPEKFMLYTEASFLPDPDEAAISFGNWNRLERLSSDMIDVFNHWVVGWIDWNIALDTVGGPTYLKNYLDSPIVINATANEFLKQPLFYAMGHFSKFVPPGSIRIDLIFTTGNTAIEAVPFLRPDNLVAVVLLNRSDKDENIVLASQNGGYMPITVRAHSLNTVLYHDA